MKSYFLQELTDEQETRRMLCALLPGQSEPWILTATEGDAVAYFHIVSETEGGLTVQADISGRHFERDAEVLVVLRSLQADLGGVVKDDQ